MKIKGIGKVKALEIKTIFEFSKRIVRQIPQKVSSDKLAAEYVWHLFKNWKKEYFIILIVDKQNNIIKCQKLYESHSQGVEIEPREVLSAVLQSGHNKYYYFHNHPSGNLNPSEEDKITTERLTYFSNILGIKLIPHIIIVKNGDFLRISYSS